MVPNYLLLDLLICNFVYPISRHLLNSLPCKIYAQVIGIRFSISTRNIICKQTLGGQTKGYLGKKIV